MSHAPYRPTPMQCIGRSRLLADAILSYPYETLPLSMRLFLENHNVVGRDASSWPSRARLQDAGEATLERVYVRLVVGEDDEETRRGADALRRHYGAGRKDS